MKSGLKIRWTEEATKNIENIIFYLESNWTTKELNKFFQKLEKQLLLLSIFPGAYPVSSKNKSIHRCVFTENITIYYRVQDDWLVLISFFDTRQNPSKIKL
jgi:plasmid stabilization system protein ParE